MNAALMMAFDSPTLARLLGHHEKVKSAAALFREAGGLHKRQGLEIKAQTFYQRALEMYLEAVQMQTIKDAACINAVIATEELLLPERIKPHYSELMKKFIN